MLELLGRRAGFVYSSCGRLGDVRYGSRLRIMLGSSVGGLRRLCSTRIRAARMPAVRLRVTTLALPYGAGHESSGKLLGQCGHGTTVPQPENGRGAAIPELVDHYTGATWRYESSVEAVRETRKGVHREVEFEAPKAP